MDEISLNDPLVFLLAALVCILALFWIVRIVKFASRTVDKERDEENRRRNSPPS